MKMKRTCPTDTQFAQALSYDEHSGLMNHFAACDTCRQRWEDHQAIREMVRRAERSTPTREAMASVRADLLEAAHLSSAQHTAPTIRFRTAVSAVAAAVVLVATAALLYGIFYRSPSAVPPRVANGTLYAGDASDFVHLFNEPDEIVRLKEGFITVKVDKLKPGERFRVITGDAEVEVRGTMFDVTAKDDKLVSVKVHSGRVDVRIAEQDQRHLAAGDSWNRTVTTFSGESSAPKPESVLLPEPEAPFDPPSAPSAPMHGPSVRKSMPKRRVKDVTSLNNKTVPVASMPSMKSPAEDLFNEGFDAFKRNAFRRAADCFEAALVSEGHHTIAADASFWRAAALAKTNDEVSAQAALVSFLREYPDSVRAKEAAVILGWKISASNPTAAKAYFEAGQDAVDPRIRKSAARGIDALKDMLEKAD